MFWVYLLNQGPYRTPEHWSTIFITPFIILNTKNRGDLGVLGAKLHAKVRQIWCVVWKKGVRHQKTVSGWNRSHFQTARHCFPWKYRIISTCIKNPHPKKRFDDILWMFLWGGATAPGGGGHFKGSRFGKSYETKYCVCRFVIWHDVWRHVGLSDAKNSNEKGTECKKLFKFYCFFAMFLVPSFLFCAYLVFRR